MSGRKLTPAEKAAATRAEKRREAIVADLTALAVSVKGTLSDADHTAVVAIFAKHKGDGDDFRALDEKPTSYGPCSFSNGWHWKLRQTRKNSDRLFAYLEAVAVA